ncbi:hypothetical protein GGS21DRAFT_538135 [Xylaria nigripes]|nr:hypothetical protein GGS21DRAFT_538135 [Xylaria nigripes]
MEKRFADAALYLDWLDTTMEMTPNIKFVTKVDMVLRDLANTENIPAELANRARELYDRYEAENWGEDTVIDEDPETPTVGTITPTGVSTNGGDTIGVIELPAANDPIFGQHGIMYGIIVDTSGKGKTYRLRADIPRKPTKIYGHNGLTVGAWFPFQINALFWGAHGARMGGIAGSVTTGAWSIVVASAYDDLDSDHGDTLYYSGSNSHTNENPNASAPASTGTKALHASIATRNPVRVLRSGGAGGNARNRNPYLPSCGLRYDGLYRVTLFRQRTNQKRGLYDQFRLERLSDQTPLAVLQRTSPTMDEVIALNRLRGKA